MTIIGNFTFMPYNGSDKNFDDYKNFRNSISKTTVLKRLKSLEIWASSYSVKDVFTGEKLESGYVYDGDFAIPLEFIHYYEHYNIGIPYEYEEYLKDILK